ncbi:MAG TPA: aminotransferase class V-fold PLP-dependent enzyme [Gemmatimonadaceae bacterium]|nr:aminotransferase class V-fold PLP-dependent enzyme [Gemmatimonadaceae bacterium]
MCALVDQMSDSLLRFRPEFPILERLTYMVSNSLGAMPRTVEERMAGYARDWSTEGVRAWAKWWWDMPITVGDEIAPLIGADPGEVVMFPNVTIAQAAVLSALEYTPPRDTIVMTALDFPSVRYVYDALAVRLGARIVVVPSDDGIGIDLDRLLAAIDERTRLVAISHVLFRSAFIMDADAIVKRAHAVGALVSLDAFHSVGVMPVDVKGNAADFLTGGVLKWLCGGPGGSFLYVAPGVRERLAPSLTGWQAHARPFAFEPEMDYASNAFRWLNGTPTIPALYAAIDGPRIVRAAGLEAIRAKSVRQTSRLIELADKRGYAVHAPRDSARRGGTVAFAVPHGYEVAQELLARDILVDYRPEAGIRLAPHFYTTDGELDHVVAAIDDILESEAWRAHASGRAVVT